MSFQRHSIVVSLLLVTLALAACSSKSAPPVSVGTTQTAPQAAQGGEGGEGGAEAALVTYADAGQGFAIAYPAPWTQDKSVASGVKFVGGDDSMTLEFVTPAGGADAMTYAKGDTTLGTLPGYKQVGLAVSTEVKDAVVLGFEASGTSTVTGKPYTARGDRYYLPLSDGRIAVLTVVGPTGHYDREGVRDIALTFKVTK